MQNHFFFIYAVFLLGRFRNRYPRATCQEGSSDGTTIASNTRLNIINSNAIDFISSLLQRRRFKIKKKLQQDEERLPSIPGFNLFLSIFSYKLKNSCHFVLPELNSDSNSPIPPLKFAFS